MEDVSYVCGLGQQPLLFITIGRMLERTVSRHPDRPCLVSRHQGLRLSYKELGAWVDDVAASFVALGLKPGERIGIWSPNCAEWVVTQFAAARAGLVLVTINPAYRRSELEYALNLVGCRALVTADAFKSSDYLQILHELAPEIATSQPGALRAARLPQLEILIKLGAAPTAGFLRFADLAGLVTDASRQAVADLADLLQPDEPINIQFTSGTTGHPKGATLSHFNIINNAYQVAAGIRLSTNDRLCVPVPLYHCFGMVMGVLACVVHGALLVLPGESFEPTSVLAAVEAERCTALYGVPTMFIAELGVPDFARFDLTSLRTGIMAGSPCPIEVMRRVIGEMHLRELTIAYGMTETSPVSFQSSVDDPLEVRVSSVGRVHPFVEVKIVDAEGRVVPRGTHGELLTRGYSVMLGYWNDAERTAQAIDTAGWMHTGDLATLDADGYCNIVGRVKDMIIRGGENVYPREVEEFLFQHPKVEAAQVFGIPDERFGEVVCAWIKLRAGATATPEEIQVHCRENIAHYKVPTFVNFVQEFPMTVTGKIQKFVMREQMSRMLGRVEQRTA